MGILATRNYRDVQFEGADDIDGRTLKKYVSRTKGCYRCPVRCKADTVLTDGKFKDLQGTRPEFEAIIALGSKCGLKDTQALLYLCDLCSRLGIDSISTGSVIAFAMDLYDRGILTAKDTEGVDLTWGNHEAMETIMWQIVRRERLGGILSHGVQQAAWIIGQGSETFAYHTKGLELTGYDPRGLMGTALSYAVSSRGGDFTSVYATAEYLWPPEKAEREIGSRHAVDRFSPDGTATLIKRCMIVSAVLDSLGICKVPALTLIGDFNLKNEAALTSALTGWGVDAEYLLRCGERIVTVERLFNLRNGATGADDRLPDKFLEEAVTQGPTEGQTVRLTPMLERFYRVMGWDEAGYPLEEKLASLNLRYTPGVPRSMEILRNAAEGRC
jgi:aldehyde:ferredoxin oxidoreductase